MRMLYLFQKSILSGSIIIRCLLSGSGIAQIVPDFTLPSNSTIVSGCTSCEITGGTTLGENLYHSFEQFSIPTGGEVSFLNDPNIKNIFSRVTGNLSSNIDGILRAEGSSNVFLLNPNGILFGPNASLEIGGAFLATTADSVIFNDNVQFAATNPQPNSLLSIEAPIGLQFGQLPGEIVNQSNVSPAGMLNALNAPIGLQVEPGRALMLLGGDIRLEGGNITAPGGHIELASVGSYSFISLNSTVQDWDIGYAGIQRYQDIQLSNLALVDTSDLTQVEGVNGSVRIRGRNITLEESSQIFAFNFGVEAGGDLRILASDSVILSGADLSLGVNSSIFTVTFGAGAAGDLEISSRSLTVEGGASIGSVPLSSLGGPSGRVIINSLDSIDVASTADGIFPSFIGIQVRPDATGDGQDLILTTRWLRVRDGGQIATTTFGLGDAGNLTIVADAIELAGTSEGIQIPSGIFSVVEEGASGNAGKLDIETRVLTVTDGAQISNATRNFGQGEDLRISASESILLSGSAPKATLLNGSSGIFVSAEEAYVASSGEFIITTGNSGNLIINTEQLTVEDGARISADTFGSGNGGTVRGRLEITS